MEDDYPAILQILEEKEEEVAKEEEKEEVAEEERRVRARRRGWDNFVSFPVSFPYCYYCRLRAIHRKNVQLAKTLHRN